MPLWYNYMVCVRIVMYSLEKVMKNYFWLKVDTASIMFTSLSTKKWGRSYRTAAVFKDEEVNPELLRRAAADVMKRFPSIHMGLRKGFFWNYLEGATSLPEIREEYSRTLLPITSRNDSRPDFRLVYHKRRIAMESSHHIGDGKGSGAYFGALLERYSQLCDDPNSEYVYDEPTAGEITNSYADYFVKGGEKSEEDNTPAYQLPGEIEEGYIQLIFAMIDLTALREKSKEKGLTITEYVSSALILGTIRNESKPIDENVCIAIPVNLRQFFDSESVRNFTLQSRIDFHPQGRRDWTFDEVCDVVRGQLKERLTKENMQKELNRIGSLAANPVLKIVPNFIKLPVLRTSQKKSHGTQTTIFTNTGIAEFSPALASKLERVEGINGDTSGYGLISTCSSVTCGDVFSLCFSICAHGTDWAKECVRVLSGEGLPVRIESTEGK